MPEVQPTPVKEHADSLSPEVKAANDKAADIAAAHEQFAKDVQAANDKRNEVLAKYPDTSLAGITATAWNNVKDASDPVFANCILSHREKLAAHAESVQRVGVPAENPSDFEVEVARLLEEAKPKAKAVLAKK